MPDETKPEAALAKAAADAAAEGGDGRGARETDPGAGAQAAAAAAQPETEGGEDPADLDEEDEDALDDDHGPEEGDEELDADEDDDLDADADPRLHAAKPTFTHRDAFARALQATSRGDHVILADDVDALQVVFDRIAKAGPMAPETAYRMLRAEGVECPPWENRTPAMELQITIFVAVAPALNAIAEAQRAAFEKVVRELQGEAKLQAMRQRRAGRRAKKAARKARRPAAVKKLLAIQARNRAAAANPKPPPAAKGKRTKKGPG